jgi:NAD(P)-dependent dehydrogenase (short-subunit alcohol dehydrogenase family)
MDVFDIGDHALSEVIGLDHEDVDTLLVTELSRLGRSTGQVISLIDQLVQQGIRVNAIMPGPIATTMMEDVAQMVPGADEQFVNMTPVNCHRHRIPG